MAELNRELKEYLARNGTRSGDKETLLPTTIKDLNVSKFSSWFSRSKDNQDEDASNSASNGSSSSASNWFSTAQSDPCFPSLVRTKF